jgi:alkyl hydroperoxide reductase subunit F
MYDTIIIGAGPAGFTAGIYAARREMKALIISKETGGQLIWAADIENYPGFSQISNTDLIKKMEEHVKGLGVEIKTDEVNKIEKNDDGNFVVYTNKEKFETKTIIVAIGSTPRRLAIPGEEKFSGKGVSYCANCDGPFFRDKIVAVVGGGNSAIDAAEIMSKIAKKVYLIHRQEEFKAFAAAVREVKARDNVEFILNSEVKEISGSQSVEKIKIFNNKTNKETEMAVNGIFIEIGRIASTDLVKDLAERNEKMEIIVDEKCATSTEGLFAAGDVTQVPFKQITIACGQGTIAALAAYQYIQQKQGKDAKVVMDRSVHKARANAD